MIVAIEVGRVTRQLGSERRRSGLVVGDAQQWTIGGDSGRGVIPVPSGVVRSTVPFTLVPR